MTKNVTIRGRLYTLVYDFDLAALFQAGKKLPRWKSILLVLLFLAVVVSAGILVNQFMGRMESYTNVIFLLMTILFTFLLHEGIHGLFFWVFGGRPRFGIKVIGGWRNVLWGLVLYATADAYYTRAQYFIVGLSPLLVISVMAAVVSWFDSLRGYALIAAGVNAIGAVGDVYMMAKLAKFPPSSMVRDTADGYEVYAAAAVPSTDISSDL